MFFNVAHITLRNMGWPGHEANGNTIIMFTNYKNKATLAHNSLISTPCWYGGALIYLTKYLPSALAGLVEII